MSEQYEQPHIEGLQPLEPLAVDPELLRRTERINGIKLQVGRMSTEELLSARDYAERRMENAVTDMMILDDHIYARQRGLTN